MLLITSWEMDVSRSLWGAAFLLAGGVASYVTAAQLFFTEEFSIMSRNLPICFFKPVTEKEFFTKAFRLNRSRALTKNIQNHCGILYNNQRYQRLHDSSKFSSSEKPQITFYAVRIFYQIQKKAEEWWCLSWAVKLWWNRCIVVQYTNKMFSKLSPQQYIVDRWGKCPLAYWICRLYCAAKKNLVTVCLFINQ